MGEQLLFCYLVNSIRNYMSTAKVILACKNNQNIIFLTLTRSGSLFHLDKKFIKFSRFQLIFKCDGRL